ncbi:MAG: hypothetical protein ABEH65_03545 [Halobacteriales archaeon]
MVESQWLFVLVLGLIVIDALVTYHVYRLRERSTSIGSDGESGDTNLVDFEDGTVECPDCGAENDYGYRYCRSCVNELPGAVKFKREVDSPLGRLTN